eukprot:201050_1
MERDGFSVDLCDSHGIPFPSVTQNERVYVLAKPGKHFQVMVHVGEELRDQNVKAIVLVDGQRVGINKWMSSGRSVFEGFRASKETADAVWKFKFADANPDCYDPTPEDMEMEKEGEDLDDNTVGKVEVQFFRFRKPEARVCTHGCAGFGNFGGGGGGSEIGRERYMREPQESENRHKFWQAPSLRCEAGDLLEKPSKKRRRDDRNSYRQPAAFNNYNNAYNGGSSYNYASNYATDAYGYPVANSFNRPSYNNYNQTSGARKVYCRHTTWQRNELLGTLVLFYHTPESLILRGLLMPETDPDHKRALEESGYYDEMKARKAERRARIRRKKERARRDGVKREPKDVIDVDLSRRSRRRHGSDVKHEDDKKRLVRGNGQETCDLTREDHLEVWYVKRQQAGGIQSVPREAMVIN